MKSARPVLTTQGSGALRRPLSSPLRGEGPYRRTFRSDHTPPPTAQETEATEASPSKQFKQSDLKTYQVPKGRLFPVLLGSLGAVARLNSGLLVAGYTWSFVKERVPGEYYPFQSGRLATFKESTTKIGSYKRPEKPIEIYEYQACPFCLKVREAACILDLDVMYYPTPRGAPHHRPIVKELGGKELFPYMVDPNTGKSLYESDAIVKYLFEEYGDGTVPLPLNLGPLTGLTCAFASLLRFGRGFNYRKAKYPDEPLVLWGYELSPFTKFVREAMVELELPFLQICCARGSPKRQQLKDRVGAFQAPYLEDPNTGVALFESDKILEYLEETYAL